MRDIENILGDARDFVQHTHGIGTISTAQMPENVLKLGRPRVSSSSEGNLRLGRCDSYASIRRASRRLAQWVIDGKVTPAEANSAGFNLGVAMKALEREHEEAASKLSARGNVLPAPQSNISFEDGGPGDYGVQVSDKLGNLLPFPDDPNEASRVYQEFIRKRPTEHRLVPQPLRE